MGAEEDWGHRVTKGLGVTDRGQVGEGGYHHLLRLVEEEGAVERC